MKKSIIFTIIALLAVISIVTIIWILQVQYKPDYSSQKRAHQYFGQLNFSLKLLDSLQKEQPNESIIYSPHSLYQVLLLAYFGAGGKTEKELKDLLGLHWAESKADIEYMYELEKEVRAERFQSQSQNQTIEFNSVNKLYVSAKFRLKYSVKKLLNDRIEQLNFDTDLDQCIKQINQFVEKITKNQIQNLIRDEIKEHTALAIVNAVYFKGDWEKRFDKADTERELFYGRQHVHVDMMYKEERTECGLIESLKVRFLKVPYKGEDGSISMYIFLPLDNSTSIDDLLGKFTPKILDYAFNRVEIKTPIVHILIPKFSLEKTSDLESAMKRMGSQNLFKNSNFNGFFEASVKTGDNKMVHKAKIEVNEEGSTASAATLFGMPLHSIHSRPKSVVFK
ncbi:serine protease inhibitor 88Ea-like isoform X2 [Contarinia nasturtii]|nr:serine protease inhibitor 88Ea-like isoform X2 [Contarinia nasturtii]